MTRLLLLTLLALLAGCASDKPQQHTIFDFGPAAAGAPTAARGAIGTVVVADVTGPASLDNERIVYRLNYANPLEAPTYANSRWSATPLQLLTQRFKVRLTQAGVKVLASTDASDGVPILRIEVDDFTHTFDGAADSHGDVAVRASLFQHHKLLDQRAFRKQTAAGSANAAGGAAALAASTDAIAAEVTAWLATIPAPQR